MLPVTAFFAGIFGIMYVGLAVLVIRQRYKLRLSLGDGGDNGMLRVIRAHANFAEYIPFCLLLLGINELQHTSESFILGLGWLLLLGRFSHAYSLVHLEPRAPGKFIFRQIGMVSTFTVIICASVLLLLG